MSDSVISVENLGKRYRISRSVERQHHTPLRLLACSIGLQYGLEPVAKWL